MNLYRFHTHKEQELIKKTFIAIRDLLQASNNGELLNIFIKVIKNSNTPNKEWFAEDLCYIAQTYNVNLKKDTAYNIEALNNCIEYIANYKGINQAY